MNLIVYEMTFKPEREFPIEKFCNGEGMKSAHPY